MTTTYIPQPSSLAAEVIMWFAKRAPETELSIPQALREFDRVKNTAQVAPCLNSPVSHGVLNRARNEQAQLVYRRGRHFDGCLAQMRPRMVTPATADQRAAAPAASVLATAVPAAEYSPAAAVAQTWASPPAPPAETLQERLQRVDREIEETRQQDQQAIGAANERLAEATQARELEEARQQDQQASSEAQIASGSQWLARKLEEARSADQAAPAAAARPERRGGKRPRLPAIDLATIKVEQMPMPDRRAGFPSRYDEIFAKLQKPDDCIKLDAAYRATLVKAALSYARRTGRRISVLAISEEQCGLWLAKQQKTGTTAKATP